MPASDLGPIIDRASLPAYVILTAAAVSVALGFALTRFDLITTEPLKFAATSLLLVATGMLANRYRMGTIAPILEGLGMMGLSAIIGILATLLLSAIPFPLADPMLAAADRALGFDFDAQLRVMRDHPVILDVAHYVYRSLIWQPGAAILILSLTGQANRCRAFVVAWIIAVTISVLIWPFFPSLTTYPAYGLQSGEVPNFAPNAPWQVANTVIGIRDGTLRAIDDSTAFLGLITFPSFHAAGAALVAWSFWRTRWLWLPFCVLNAAVAITAIPIGGHYVVDIPAGIAVAAVALLLARTLIDRKAGS